MSTLFKNANQPGLRTPFGLVPPEGARVVPIAFDFTVATTFNFSYDNQQALGQLASCQTIFVDNAVNASPVTITWGGAGQSIVLAAYSQGYYAVLVPNPIAFAITSSGSSCVLYLINYVIPPSVWSVRGLPIVVTQSGSGDAQLPFFAANKSANGSVTTTAAAVITGNPGYFVEGISLSLSADATIGVAGDLVVTFQDSTTPSNIWVARFSLPAVVPVLTQGAVLHIETGAGFLWTSPGSNKTLSVNMSVPLTNGSLSYNINYGLTSFVG